jgi:hypothetical protein
MRNKWRDGPAAADKDPAFEAAVQRHVQESLGHLLAKEVCEPARIDALLHLWVARMQP